MLAALLIAATAGVAQAQNTAPGSTAATPGQPTSSDPGAASTPHQNDAMSHDKGMMKGKMGADSSGADPSAFVRKAALGGMTEVEAGKVAQSRASDPKIKAFAARMVKDHGKANAELAGIAKGKGLTVPMSLDGEHRSMIEELSARSGEDFDAAYASHMVMDHAKTIALFEGATKSSDADLAAFARKTLHTLKEHKQMADALPGASS
jgi:putative membrane protein